MAAEDIVIVGAARTPVGSFNGALSSIPAHELGAIAIKAALTRAKVEAAEVEAVLAQLGLLLAVVGGKCGIHSTVMSNHSIGLELSRGQIGCNNDHLFISPVSVCSEQLGIKLQQTQCVAQNFISCFGSSLGHRQVQ